MTAAAGGVERCVTAAKTAAKIKAPGGDSRRFIVLPLALLLLERGLVRKRAPDARHAFFDFRQRR